MNQSQQMASVYRKQEQVMRRAYKQQVREIERASFMPLVFVASGWMGKAATVVYKLLAGLLAQKWHQPYSTTMGWVCTALRFALLRSAVLCLRGSQARRSPIVTSEHALDLMVSEGHFCHWQCMPFPILTILFDPVYIIITILPAFHYYYYYVHVYII